MPQYVIYGGTQVTWRPAVCRGEGVVNCLISKLCVANAKSNVRNREERREQMPGLEEGLFRRDETLADPSSSFHSFGRHLPFFQAKTAKSEDVDDFTSSAQLICCRALPQAFSWARPVPGEYDNLGQSRQALPAIFDFATRNKREAPEMTHNASVGTQVVPEDIRDIRGTSVRGADDKRLGDVSDVIVDHETMQIRYLVVDSQGWLDSQTFLLPAERIAGDKNDDANLAANVTREQIEHAPRYDDEARKSGTEWKEYERAFQKYWEDEPVMHLKGSDRIITLPEEPPSTHDNSAGPASQPEDRELNAADLFPERITSVFPDPAPGSGKITLRPKSVVRAEEAASGVSLLKPRWWESFENYLRVHKEDIQANCPECPSKAA